MLTEDAVTRAVREHLAAGGWQIVSQATPDQHGTDLAAVRNGTRLEVEAKGGGSSKLHTAPYGQPFTTAQVRVHVGEAVLTALKVVATGTAGAAVAFPDTPRHRAQAGPVESVLHRLGITVYLGPRRRLGNPRGFSAQLGMKQRRPPARHRPSQTVTDNHLVSLRTTSKNRRYAWPGVAQHDHEHHPE